MTYSSPRKKYLYMTHTTGLPEFFVGFTSYPLTRMCFNRVQSGCYHLLIWSNQHNIINIVHQRDIFWKRHDLDLFEQSYNTGWRVHMSLSKAVKVYCWPCQLKANCFWWSLWAGTKKKAFAGSAAAYHVQADVHVQVICSSKDITSSTDSANWESPHDYAFNSQSPWSMCLLHWPIGELKGDVVGTTIPAHFKSLRVALISSIPPGMWNCLWFVIFPGGDNSNGFHLAFPTIISLTPQVREPNA